VYPPIEPYEHGLLDVGDGNSVYWESVGTPLGTPALYLHGGPGSGATVGARRYFDPTAFQAVLFDQRGCGRSRPLVTDPGVVLSTNTTDHLVADIERLREHLSVERWVVVGVSWGSALALIYAQRHPDRVRGLVLGPVTAGTRREVTWITRDMGRVFPKQWEEFLAAVPVEERDDDLATAYARLLSSPDPVVREDAARRWCDWEDTHVSLMPGWRHRAQYDDPSFRMVFATLVTHYWSHGCFLRDDEIFKGMHRLANIPGVLVHGRHDISSPLETAWRLHQAWPASRLVVVDDAGHGGGSFGIEFVAAIVQFTFFAGDDRPPVPAPTATDME
jgi:proline iminopeptidase